VLAHGLPETAEDRRPVAASAGISEPAFHNAGTSGRTHARLSPLDERKLIILVEKIDSYYSFKFQKKSFSRCIFVTKWKN
jgi:hypothetical protein